ncbi:hypothetical protein VPH35_114951 [Triticum aestivum]|uniref:Uncharacterized protein n=1 Tax=Aegilops tauschii TaxID=37682 RepID=R7W492_AEGTA
MAPLTLKLCWRSCCHRQPEDASSAGTVPRFAPGTAAGASRSLSMNRTVRCSCPRVSWSSSGRTTNTTTPMSTRTARLPAKMMLRNPASRPPGEASLRKSLSLARMEASASFLVFF